MTYSAVGAAGFGAFDFGHYVQGDERASLKAFWGLSADPNEVYVYRFDVSSARPLTTPVQAATMLRAFAETHHFDHDVRGIVIDDRGGGAYRVDMIVTAPESEYFELTGTKPTDIAAAMAAHPEVKARFPGANVRPGVWLELVDASERNHWLQSPRMWDHALKATGTPWNYLDASGSGEKMNPEGAPTQAFHDLANIWLGRASKRRQRLAGAAPPKLFPPSGGAPLPPGRAAAGADETLWFGIAAVAAVGLYALTKDTP